MRTTILAIFSCLAIFQATEAFSADALMYCSVSQNGHRFVVTATNPNNRALFCKIDCPYTLNGVAGNQHCEGTLPANAKNVSFCTTDNSSATFKVTGKGTYNCN